MLGKREAAVCNALMDGLATRPDRPLVTDAHLVGGRTKVEARCPSVRHAEPDMPQTNGATMD